MLESFWHLFDTEGFPARWNCGTWSPELGWTHILADLAIFGAYTAIPLVIAFFVIRRRDVPFPRIFWLFVLFIFACGTTHLIEAIIFWEPVYRFAGLVKVLTAAASWATVFSLAIVMPAALRLPGLANLNTQLTREIDERKQTELALRQSEERLRMAQRAGGIGTFQWEFPERRARVSEIYRQIFGLPQDREWTSSDEWFSSVYRSDQEALRQHLSAVMRGEDSPTSEYRIVRPDGQIRWVEYSGQLQRDSRGEPAQMTGTVQDVTERKLGEQRIRDNEERLRLALAAGGMGTWEWTVEANQIRWSAELEAIHGLEPGTFAGTFEAFLADVHPEDHDRVAEQVRSTVQNGDEHRIEYRIIRPDGQCRWVEGRGMAFRDEAGKPLRMVGICVDITDRKESDDQREDLLQSERAARSEAERANRLKDEFLSIVSHELRTPLNAILGYVQLLRMGKMTPEEVEESLEAVERNSRAQVQIIDDLLDMSRIISGRIRLDVRSVNLADVIEAAIETVRPGAEAKEIHLQATLDPSADLVLGDFDRLQQVMWNLLSNAVKFTPKGGRVQVALRRVNSQVEINVTDTGQGIAPEFLPYVFDRFRQADGATSRRHGGLGLGLAIVKQLVELHGGSVRVQSEGEGSGATFTVVLPLQAMLPRQLEEFQRPAAVEVTRDVGEESPNLAGVQVLIVDDDRDSRDIVRRFLEDCGAKVITVFSAEVALEVLQQSPPTVLVSDIGMPGKDGYEFIREVRAREANGGARIPAVALTAFARSEDRRRAMMAGYQCHVTKPVDPGELLAVIAMLSGRTNVS